MNATVLEASVSFREHAFARPLVLSSGSITKVTEARALVRVRVGRKEAEGLGSVLLSHLWAGGDDAGMRKACEGIARDLVGEMAHPMELGLRLNENARSLDRVVCASPFDAAIHDAAGRALGRSAFTFYDGDDAVEGIREVLRPPVGSLEGWWVVGEGPEDPHGFRNLKIKTKGKDPETDARRVEAIFDAMRPARISVDPNEGHEDVGSVLAFLKALRKDVFDALLYMEQPTPRNLTFDWREVARLKPVILDEGMAGPRDFERALSEGWSGIALKTAKGHSFCLLAAAWARRHGLLLTLQDLTNVGPAAVHAALLGARVETLNGIELNAEQFIPGILGPLAARQGIHEVPPPDSIGLGSVA